MSQTLLLGGHQVAWQRGIDISIPIRLSRTSGRITSFSVPFADSQTLFSPDASEQRGCICCNMTICPHVHGTHIESFEHIDPASSSSLGLLSTLKPLMIALLIPVQLDQSKAVLPKHLSNDFVVPHAGIEAVVIKTGWALGNACTREDVDYTHMDPPFLAPQTIEFLIEHFPQIRVLLVDLPSVDPQSDDGLLLAHRAFFKTDLPAYCGSMNLIVELCRIPGELPLGVYALNLNVCAIDSDAIPCRPILYPIDGGEERGA